MGTSRQKIQKNITELSKYLYSNNIIIKRNFKTETINITNFMSEYLIKFYYMNNLISKLISIPILNKLITASNY